MKSKRTVGLPQNWHPVAFPFKDGGGLAENPLICHHQRCLAAKKMEKKMKESEAEKRRSEKAESFPSVLLIDK